MGAGPIGRDTEIAEISAFLSATSGAPAALTITGDAGIGKTTVWKRAVQDARQSSQVLSCQPASAERPLAFSAIGDLLGGVVKKVLPALPRPRRQAVEAALLLDSSAQPPLTDLFGIGHPVSERRTLAQGVLDALRILSDDSPLMVAVDDAQWLDRPSASVLRFCFRRLEEEPISIMLTFWSNNASIPLGLDRALPPDRLGHVRLGSLSLGAIGEILRSRLGALPPRYTLTRLYEACGGNPFYALECARALLDHPPASFTNEPIPLPESLSDLVRRRVRRLTPDARRIGQLVAACSDRRERRVRVACGDGESWAAIDQAIDAGIIERDGDALRFTHPLLRSLLYTEMTLGERRQLHQRLAASAEDVEDRAWHLALAAARPSEKVAGMLDAAANHAASRGAPEAAAPLGEQAIRLTPASGFGAARDRTVRAADYHFRAGDVPRSRELIDSALAACKAGALRAPLLLRLATIHFHQSGWTLAEQTFRQAAHEAPDDPALCAHAEQEIAFARVMAGDLPGALRWAKVSLRSAERASDPRLVADSLARVAAFEFLHGDRAWPALLERAELLDASVGGEPAGRVSLFHPILVRGLILKWCDRLDEARLKLADSYRHALDRGEEASLPFLLYHYSQLECWAGNWDIAEQYAMEGCRVAEESHQLSMRPATLYSLALVRAHRGQVDQARELASEALSVCEQTGNIPIASQVAGLFGFLALSLGDHQAVHAHLGGLAATTAAIGLGEPSVVKFLPDEIEALAAHGEVDLAWSFARQLEAQGKSLARPWALATGARCRAHLTAISGDLEAARAACEQALSQHQRLPMPFELARTLLVKGMIERRARCRQTSRESLSRALGIFEQLGALLWADKARRELSKITTRRSIDGLTEAESRVAALVAQGLTNRGIASAMFVTENTVQTHIRHIFLKLGVRSRTELAVQFRSAPASTATAVGPARRR